MLDVIDVPLLAHRPSPYQPENWLLDPDRYWKKAARLTWDDLHALVDLPQPLWINSLSSYHGIYDRVAADQVELIHDSLRFIKVSRVALTVFKPGEAFGNPKRSIQAQFKHNGVEYILRVTDPIFERAYFSRSDGTYTIGESFLTISLSEPFEGYCYKLIAAVIPKNPADAV